jgi:hypothetical protein
MRKKDQTSGEKDIANVAAMAAIAPPSNIAATAVSSTAAIAPPSTNSSPISNEIVSAKSVQTIASPFVSPIAKKIISIQPRFGALGKPLQTDTSLAAERAKDIIGIARSYEPLVGKIVELFNHTSIRVFRFVSKNSIAGYQEITGRDEKEKVESIAQHVALDKTSCDLATCSLSRIAARRIKGEETMDFVALGSVAIDYATGVATAISELHSIRNEIKECLGELRKHEDTHTPVNFKPPYREERLS